MNCEPVLPRAVNLSLAVFPGLPHEQAARLAVEGARAGELCEPSLGPLVADHVQLVPQSRGRLDEALCASLLAAYPSVAFRLHANVNVLDHHCRADLSGFQEQREWFEQAARISRSLRARAYSAHAGRRAEASMRTMLRHARHCADLFGCPVAVEGHYPTTRDEFIVSSWEEYRMIFESGVPYALDLSHLHILATATGVREVGLVQEMLNCERCLEVHVSDNDGRRDSHEMCSAQRWWFALLPHLHRDAVVFTEGNRRPRRHSP